MKLDKAIEILTHRVNISGPLKNPDFTDTLKLSIEALKVIDKARSRGYSFASILLPGEDSE